MSLPVEDMTRTTAAFAPIQIGTSQIDADYKASQEAHKKLYGQTYVIPKSPQKIMEDRMRASEAKVVHQKMRDTDCDILKVAFEEPPASAYPLKPNPYMYSTTYMKSPDQNRMMPPPQP